MSGYILSFPAEKQLLGGRLDTLSIVETKIGNDLLFDFHGLRLMEVPSIALSGDKRPFEQINGLLIPLRLRFANVRWYHKSSLFSALATVPLNHPIRQIHGLLNWLYPPLDPNPLYLFLHGSHEVGDLMFSATDCLCEDRSGVMEPISERRHWSPAPLLPEGPAAENKPIHAQKGGDPVAIQLGNSTIDDQLFVGSLEMQEEKRPFVDVVLNLGEKPSRWAQSGRVLAPDRWVAKGEGSAGMTVREIEEEAEWVLNHLRAGKCVLVHCVAGFNRSVTICCAVLMLMEGLTAVDALQRIWQHHPWARPDSHHWLMLKCLQRKIVNINSASG